jgi:hypothetical protein
MWNCRNGNPNSCVLNPSFAFLTALLVILQGCATANINISPEDRTNLKNAPAIYVVRYQSPAMDVMSPKSVVSGGLITAMTGSMELPSGFELQRAYGLPEASEELTTHFVRKLTSEGRLTNLRVEPKPLSLPHNDEVSHYRSKYMGGLVLEVFAMQGAGYQVMHWQTYNFGMLGKVRLIRVADNKVLWQDLCNVNGLNDDALTLDVKEFEANNGARLKQLIPLSADRCSRVLTDKLLGKTS